MRLFCLSDYGSICVPKSKIALSLIAFVVFNYMIVKVVALFQFHQTVKLKAILIIKGGRLSAFYYGLN